MHFLRERHAYPTKPLMLTSLCFDLVLLGKAKLSARPIERGIPISAMLTAMGFESVLITRDESLSVILDIA